MGHRVTALQGAESRKVVSTTAEEGGALKAWGPQDHVDSRGELDRWSAVRRADPLIKYGTGPAPGHPSPVSPLLGRSGREGKRLTEHKQMSRDRREGSQDLGPSL